MSRKSLNVEIRVGESIAIDGGRLVIRLVEKSGQRARLHFDAEHDAAIEPVRASPIGGMREPKCSLSV